MAWRAAQEVQEFGRGMSGAEDLKERGRRYAEPASRGAMYVVVGVVQGTGSRLVRERCVCNIAGTRRDGPLERLGEWWHGRRIGRESG